uniref:Ion transport domain-containing protein n=1 Tax=Glossina pallidipes TaxID=7398 RepID=A0A1A9ZSE7_GLOPL
MSTDCGGNALAVASSGISGTPVYSVPNAKSNNNLNLINKGNNIPEVVVNSPSSEVYIAPLDVPISSSPRPPETIEDTGSEGTSGDVDMNIKKRRRYLQNRRSVVNPDENFYFYWLMALTICVLYNLWTLIVRQSFPELEQSVPRFWLICDVGTDIVFIFDILVQLRTGYLEQGLMVYDDKKLACHYIRSRDFILDLMTLIPLDLLQIKMGAQPLLRFTRFFKVCISLCGN